MLTARLRFKSGARFLRVDQAAVVHQTADLQSRQRLDLLCECQRGRIRRNAAAMQTSVHFDEHRNFLSDPHAKRRQLRRTGLAVDNGMNPGTLHQLSNAFHLILADQRIGDQNIVDPVIRHHLRLRKPRAGDALCAKLQLLHDKIHALVRLDMRTDRNSMRLRQRLHLLQIFRYLVKLHHDRRCWNIVIHASHASLVK